MGITTSIIFAAYQIESIGQVFDDYSGNVRLPHFLRNNDEERSFSVRLFHEHGALWSHHRDGREHLRS